MIYAQSWVINICQLYCVTVSRTPPFLLAVLSHTSKRIWTGSKWFCQRQPMCQCLERWPSRKEHQIAKENKKIQESHGAFDSGCPKRLDLQMTWGCASNCERWTASLLKSRVRWVGENQIYQGDSCLSGNVTLVSEILKFPLLMLAVVVASSPRVSWRMSGQLCVADVDSVFGTIVSFFLRSKTSLVLCDCERYSYISIILLNDYCCNTPNTKTIINVLVFPFVKAVKLACNHWIELTNFLQTGWFDSFHSAARS